MHTQSEMALAVDLSFFGMAAPKCLDDTERMLHRFERMLDRRPDDENLGRLVSHLRERVDALGMQDLAARLSSLH